MAHEQLVLVGVVGRQHQHGRIAGDAQQHEDEDEHADDDDHRLREPARDVASHGPEPFDLSTLFTNARCARATRSPETARIGLTT